MNLAMLFSIVLGALGIYLVLKELKLPALYACFVATGIAFLSPQIARIPYHFTLSYVFIIPFFLWLIMRFHQAPGIKKSIVIGLYTFLVGTIHLYFLSMFGVIAMVYHATTLFHSQARSKKLYWKTFCHFFIQLILPFVLVQMLVYFTDTIVTDRTNNPYGILIYVASLKSIFLPVNRPLGEIIGQYISFKKVEWEGIAFVGCVSVITIIFLLISFVYKRFIARSSTLFRVPENLLMRSFLWSACLLLLYSFGFPFKFNLQFLLDYVGFLKQMRGIARFSWVFYYVINIYVFYRIYLFAQKQKYRLLRWSLYVLPLCILYYDAYCNVDDLPLINNKIAALDDTGNTLEQDQWLNKINPRDYQAIIALPYFHVGSESIWVKSETSDIPKYTYIISLKTGLPVTDVALSRTSLSQTYKNVAMVYEPYRPLSILPDFKNAKPFLMIVCEQDINETELALLRNAKLLFRNESYGVYALSYETLANISQHISDNVAKEFASVMQDNNQAHAVDSSYVYFNFDKNKTENSYMGGGAYPARIHDRTVLYNGILPHAMAHHTYVLSFWCDHLTEDLYPRSSIEIIEKDAAGKIISESLSTLFKLLKTIDGDWGLYEYPFILHSPEDTIAVRIWSEDIRSKKKEIYFDELLIRPLSSDIYYKKGDTVFKNDRFYKASEDQLAGALYTAGSIVAVDRPDELREQVNEKIEEIRADKEWMESVAKKAADRHISLDSALLLDARYMIEMQDIKARAVREQKEKTDKIIGQIRADANWFDHIKKQAQELKISIDSSLILNARYMIETQK